MTDAVSFPHPATDARVSSLPKAELHVHLEGTASPALVRRLAKRNGMTLPDRLFAPDGGFAWTDFLDFLRAYDDAAATIRTEADYRDVTHDYLRRCAEEGAVYVEVTSSPDHAALAGLSFEAHLDGIEEGIRAARTDFGIEARIIVTCIRHFGVEQAIAVARACARRTHRLVTGFGMAGDENAHPASAFRRAFEIAHHEAGLSCTVHAGEAAGPDSVRDALDSLPVIRIGHGVRASEDPDLVARIAEGGYVLEVCPTSNVRTRVYPDYETHPLNRLRAAGCVVTLNSDDPPYFATTIGREYAIAHRYFGMDPAALRSVTRAAIDAAFVDAQTRAALIARVEAGDQAPGSRS